MLSNRGAEFLVVDTIRSLSFKVKFLQYLILKFFQARPGTAEDAAALVEKRCDLEMEAESIDQFMQMIETKHILEPGIRTRLTLLQRAKLKARIEEKVRNKSRRHFLGRTPSEAQKDFLSQLFMLLHRGDMAGLLDACRRQMRSTTAPELAGILHDTVRDDIVTLLQEGSKDQVKHGQIGLFFTLLKPQAFFNLIKKPIDLFFSTPVIVVVLAMFAYALHIFWSNRDFWIYGYANHVYIGFTHFIPALVISWSTMILHEFFHASACVHFGGRVRRIGGMLRFYIAPGMFADVTDTYFMPKRRRIAVFCAGAGGQLLLLWAPATVIWFATEKGSLLNTYAHLLALVNGFAILGNLLPLFKTDGYYILSDLLDIENLTNKSFRHCSYKLRKWVGWPADDPQVEASGRGRFWLWFYFLFTSTYLLVTFSFGILILLLPLSWRGLQPIHYFLRYLSYFTILFWFVFLAGRLRSAIQKNPAFLSGFIKKHRTALLAASLALALVALWKTPMTVPAQGFARPASVISIRAPGKGALREVHVAQGESVSEGQMVAVLDDPALSGSLRKAHLKAVSLTEELRTMVAGPTAEERNVSGRRLETGRIRLKQAEADSLFFLKARESGVISHDRWRDELNRLEQEEAEFQIALAEFGKLTSPSRMEDVETKRWKLVEAELHLGEMRAAIEALEIRSPIDGVVLTADTDDLPGKALEAGEEILQIGSPGKVLHLEVAEADITKIRVGDRVRAVPATGTVSLQARVSEIAPTAGGDQDIVLESRSLSWFPPVRKVVVRAEMDSPLFQTNWEILWVNAKIRGQPHSILHQATRGLRRFFQVNFWASL